MKAHLKDIKTDSLLPLISAFAISFGAVKIIRPFAVKAGLVDVPNERKLHDGAIPLIGGICIYLGVLMASFFFIKDNQAINIYFVSAAMLLFLGVLDDKYDLSVRLRLVSQVIVASMMIFGAGFYLESLGYVLGFEVYLGTIGIFVTVIAAINAFNMVDGIDGLAGMLSLITFAALAYLLSHAGSDWYLLPVLFNASILAYLMFNLSIPKRVGKIFMGDAGSMLIGLTVVWLFLIGTSEEVKAFRPITALYLIAIPLMDMASIMYRRIRKGVSPFHPDRNHLHHIFELAGFNRRQTLAIISVMGIVFALVGCVFEFYAVPEWIMFVGFVGIFFTYTWVLTHVWLVLSIFRRMKKMA